MTISLRCWSAYPDRVRRDRFTLCDASADPQVKRLDVELLAPPSAIVARYCAVAAACLLTVPSVSVRVAETPLSHLSGVRGCRPRRAGYPAAGSRWQRWSRLVRRRDWTRL